ncbi:hypothetical protein A0H81_11810 [Grifola frondosa]|uniref:Uncharacterized protein n=1 Tax=Grifola frondosa TaxID=5627 RepID=A0A1C7LUK0_GRIFR|nr:hypothetical protein A0H81_11810 [Grifola frondosa]
MYMKRFALTAVIAAGLQLSSAQTISSQCQSALTTVVGSSDATCLNAQALIGMFLQPACTNATLAAIVTNVTAGCSTELSSLGLSNASAGEITTIIQTAYPTVRQIACLSDSSTNTLCVTETLNNIQTYTGNLSISNIEAIASQAANGTFPSVPSNVTCTDCTKQALNIFKQDFPDLLTSSVQSTISSTCGASFTDGAEPSTVTELASNSTATSTGTSNGASAISVGPIVAVGITSLLAVTSAFALLA